jgi:PAS domain-containing protein
MAADVTDRKEGEAALRESEIRMRALLDASQDEILLVSIRGEVLAINKAAERRLARRTGGFDLVGAHLDRLLPRDQVEQRMAIVRQVASTARSFIAIRRSARAGSSSGFIPCFRRTGPCPRWLSMRGRSPSRRNRRRT